MVSWQMNVAAIFKDAKSVNQRGHDEGPKKEGANRYRLESRESTHDPSVSPDEQTSDSPIFALTVRVLRTTITRIGENRSKTECE